MDTIFQLPLFILACVLAIITTLHITPFIGFRLSRAIRDLQRNTASRAVLFTLGGALALLAVSSLYELSKGADRVRSGNLRGEVLATVDYLRGQVSGALSLANLLILLLNLALSSERCSLDFTRKNLAALQRQVKGLQAEYERVTATPATAGDRKAGSSEVCSDGANMAAEEAAALKRMVDRLIAEKQQLQDSVEAAEKEAKASEARVTAMVSQVKSYDREFDRLLDENKVLKAKLTQQDQTGASGVTVSPLLSKKDD